jgi:hypothetical protein
MNQAIVPQNVLDDLSKFISSFSDLPHPVLIAQKFCLKHKEHGEQLDFPLIISMIEQLIKKNS